MGVNRTYYSLNLMRFVFAIIIFLFHVNVLPRGYIGVEFFFLLSGVFLYKKFKSADKEYNMLYDIKKRYITYFPYTTLCILGTCVLAIVYNNLNFAQSYNLLKRGLMECTLLGGTGLFNGSHYISDSYSIEILISRHLWFIMCLLIAIPITILVFKVKEKIYLGLISLFLYGTILISFGTLTDHPSYALMWIKPCGRAIAGLLLGGFAVYISEQIKGWANQSIRLFIAYIALLWGIGTVIFDKELSEGMCVILWFIFVTGILSTNEGKLFEYKGVQFISTWLSKYSLGIYCLHPLIYVVINVYFPRETIFGDIMLSLIIIVIISSIVMFFESKLKRSNIVQR